MKNCKAYVVLYKSWKTLEMYFTNPLVWWRMIMKQTGQFFRKAGQKEVQRKRGELRTLQDELQKL